MVLTLRPLAALVLCGPLLLAADGCARHPERAAAPSGEVALVYWPAPNQQEVEFADTVVTRWNRLHPDIHVRMQPIPVSQSSEEVLLAAIAGKTTPDICSNIWPGALRDYTDAGGLLALDRFAGFDTVVRARVPAELLETFRSPDGHFYQLPWKTNPEMMFYNLDLFDAAGITGPPRTYGEYLADAQLMARLAERRGTTSLWMGERDIRPIW
ncbi:MAG TPA: extracellular solute-binding protein, partial [Bacteroidota bacterium]